MPRNGRTTEHTSKWGAKQIAVPLGLISVMVTIAFSTPHWAERSKTNQARELNGEITKKQGILESVGEYLDYVWSDDPDHHTRHAYDVMITSEYQYLWSYRQWRWVSICRTRPTPCMDEGGYSFRRQLFEDEPKYWRN